MRGLWCEGARVVIPVGRLIQNPGVYRPARHVAGFEITVSERALCVRVWTIQEKKRYC